MYNCTTYVLISLQVIYTEASSGRTVIELWKEGRRVDGEEQVVQEGASASATTKTPPAPASRATPTSTPLPVSARANAVESAIPRRPLLTRKGEGTREFYFGETSRSGGGEDGAAGAAESAREMSRRLRSETERERRSMLLDIFEAAHSRRRRRRRVHECGGRRC